MADFNKKSGEARDYKELFEFRLTVGDNIICQRYFKINNFNPTCLRSYELSETIRNCAHTIDRDLRRKTQIYLETYAPQNFVSVDEMNKFFENPENRARMGYGEGIVVIGSEFDYFWGNKGPEKCSFKFDDGELTAELTDEDRVMYKFAFLIDGKEVSATVWEGVYPKYIRNSIDLSNKRGKFEGEDLSRLNFDQYLLYKLVEGANDLVYGLIKDICNTCSMSDNDDYTVSGFDYDNKYERIIPGINDERYRRKKRETKN